MFKFYCEKKIAVEEMDEIKTKNDEKNLWCIDAIEFSTKIELNRSVSGCLVTFD